METLGQDIRYALRMIVKNPTFSAIAVLSLALGIGANTTIFTVVNAILLNPLPVKDISRLVQMDTVDTKTMVTQANATKLGMSYPNFQDYEKQNQVFTGLTCISGGPLTLRGERNPGNFRGNSSARTILMFWECNPASGVFSFPMKTRSRAGITSWS